jgi:hypothetical protein
MAELQGLVDTVVAQTAGLPAPATLASWDPPLSGDIAVRIGRDGSWMHEGRPILREGLVRLFASLLRREEDGHYYLVTPAEKWRIEVERHALVVIDCEREEVRGEWQALLNTGGICRIGGENRLHAEGEAGEPWLEVPSGLTAQITRAAWYRLVDAAVEEGGDLVIHSDGERIVLGSH